MPIEAILLTITLIWLIFAFFSDLKTREVPDWLNYSLVIIAFTLRGFYSIMNSELNYFLYTLLGFGIFFAIANLMYYTKQWGGGDAKLFMALGAVFATYPIVLTQLFNPVLGQLPFFVAFFINLLIMGAVYGLIYTIILAIKNKKIFIEESKKIFKEPTIKKLKWIISIGGVIFLIIILTIVQNLEIKLLFVTMIIFLMALFYIWIFVKIVEKSCMFKIISIKKLTEGDWVCHDLIINKKRIYSSKSVGIERYQISQLLKQTKIKTVQIKEGIPFVPSFLIATIISLIFGNLIYYVI